MVKNVLVKAEVQGGNSPVMVSCNVDMTPEEIAVFEFQSAEMPEPEPTPEERMEAQVLYTALMTDTLLEV